jgi:hypothetical protein
MSKRPPKFVDPLRKLFYLCNLFPEHANSFFLTAADCKTNWITYHLFHLTATENRVLCEYKNPTKKAPAEETAGACNAGYCLPTAG